MPDDSTETDGFALHGRSRCRIWGHFECGRSQRSGTRQVERTRDMELERSGESISD